MKNQRLDETPSLSEEIKEFGSHLLNLLDLPQAQQIIRNGRAVLAAWRSPRQPEEALNQQLQDLLRHADIKINGERPSDIQIHNPNLAQRVIAGGSLALGESYMDEWWDCERLDEFFAKVLRADLKEKIASPTFLTAALKARILNLQRPSKASEVAEKHYDLSNDLFKLMLDDRMVYTCGYWDNADNLNEAQEAKLELVCQKIALKPGMRVLDIGCGWGSFSKYAAEKYNAEVVGITVSEEQATLGHELCDGLPVKIKVQDYREVDEKFDRIVSLGMFEHVGYKNYREYMKVASRCLGDDGLFLLHTLGRDTSATRAEPWITKYIFPNGMLPSPQQVSKSIEGLFVLEDWHNFGQDYDTTLMAWAKNIEDHKDDVTAKHGERFYRMWMYYLLSCAGSSRARKNQLWQIVLSKSGVPGGYKSVR